MRRMTQSREMAKMSLRTASLSCLAIWAAVWVLFLLMRISPLDIRVVPGIGMIMLVALGVAVLAPIVSTGFAGAALVRQPQAPLNWLALGLAIAVLIGQGLLFLVTMWM
jgi:hypothetical protein